MSPTLQALFFHAMMVTASRTKQQKVRAVYKEGNDREINVKLAKLFHHVDSALDLIHDTDQKRGKKSGSCTRCQGMFLSLWEKSSKQTISDSFCHKATAEEEGNLCFPPLFHWKLRMQSLSFIFFYFISLYSTDYHSFTVQRITCYNMDKNTENNNNIIYMR